MIAVVPCSIIARHILVLTEEEFSVRGFNRLNYAVAFDLAFFTPVHFHESESNLFRYTIKKSRVSIFKYSVSNFSEFLCIGIINE